MAGLMFMFMFMLGEFRAPLPSDDADGNGYDGGDNADDADEVAGEVDGSVKRFVRNGWYVPPMPLPMDDGGIMVDDEAVLTPFARPPRSSDSPSLSVEFEPFSDVRPRSKSEYDRDGGATGPPPTWLAKTCWAKDVGGAMALESGG